MALPYDAGILWNVSHKCNLRCEYCISGQVMDGDAPPIDIDRALKAMEGRTYAIGFVGGGEPLLVPNIVEASVAFSKRHFLAFFTNLTSDRVKDIAAMVDPKRVIGILASVHIKELVSRNMIDRYIRNYKLLEEKGFVLIPEAVAYPPLLQKASYYRNLFKERGINIVFSRFKGIHAGKLYPASYTDEEVSAFDFEPEPMQVDGLCNAGFNACVVNKQGLVMPCYDIDARLGHIYEGFRFEDKMRKCSIDCACPLWSMEPKLYEDALGRSH
jgi:MoaA/NifB/PqqE/SkfB family radical SAM enzyme